MFWLVVALVLDQITKHVAHLTLRGRPVEILGFFYLTYATNTGIAFGLFPGVKEVVVYLSLLIIVILSLLPLFIIMRRSTNILLSFILGGALGNLIDRIRFGYVIDFITMKYWPTIYNVADIFILVGSVGLLIQALRAELKHREEESRGPQGNFPRKRMALGQVLARKNSGLGLQNDDPKSYKEWRSAGEWEPQEAELQGEVWGYNYLESSREAEEPGSSPGEHTS